MITRAPFFTTRFGGYLQGQVPNEDVELCHVDPDTLCGEYLRRYWQPISPGPALTPPVDRSSPRRT